MYQMHACPQGKFFFSFVCYKKTVLECRIARDCGLWASPSSIGGCSCKIASKCWVALKCLAIFLCCFMCYICFYCLKGVRPHQHIYMHVCADEMQPILLSLLFWGERVADEESDMGSVRAVPDA
jgi:hypothetical protein